MPRCLIIDDDRDGREGYAEYLRAFGFDVDECADAESAWARLPALKPDILLMDLQLPLLSGWDLISRLRATTEFGTLPIIAFSACVFPDDRRRAEEAGCDVFLTKPSVPSDVLVEVKRLLRQSRPPRQSVGTPDA